MHTLIHPTPYSKWKFAAHKVKGFDDVINSFHDVMTLLKVRDTQRVKI